MKKTAFLLRLVQDPDRSKWPAFTSFYERSNSGYEIKLLIASTKLKPRKEPFKGKNYQHITNRLPWSQRFFLIFLRERDQEQAAKAATTSREGSDNESRNRRGEREKPLVTLASNLTFIQITAVKHVKLLIKRVTNGNSANTCLPAAIFLSGGRPGEIMLWTNHLHLGGKEWFVNRGQAKACVNDGRQESRNKNTTL